MITILTGNVLDTLPTLPANSVQCCVTSPPYWGLRDYGTGTWEGGDAACDHVWRDMLVAGMDGSTQNSQREGRQPPPNILYKDTCRKCGARRIDAQIGLEPTPQEYVANMVAVFREVRRVLREDGTLWLNLGSSYVSGIIESQEYVLRDDLTAKELAYVYSELAKHAAAEPQALPDLRQADESAEQEVSRLLRHREGAA